MICTTGLVALGTWAIKLAYIDHSNDPGGPLTYERMLFWNDAVVDTTTIMTVVVDLVARGVEVKNFFILPGSPDFLISLLGMAVVDSLERNQFQRAYHLATSNDFSGLCR